MTWLGSDRSSVVRCQLLRSSQGEHVPGIDKRLRDCLVWHLDDKWSFDIFLHLSTYMGKLAMMLKHISRQHNIERLLRTL